jgi:1-acyl-sn-glycerol-3-phosphate acyltransferase
MTNLISTGSPVSSLTRYSAEAPPAAVPPRSCLTRALRFAVRQALGVLLRLFIRLQVVGLENVPASGLFILASNHCSHLDGALVVMALGCRRRIQIAAARDYFFRSPLQGWFSRHVMDLIPVERHLSSRAGLRECVATLAGDEPDAPGLLLFPEGRRSADGHLQPLKSGIALVAGETGAAVIPVWIEGTFQLMPRGNCWPRPGRVRIVFGQPLLPPLPELPGARLTRRRQLRCEFTQAMEVSLRRLATDCSIGVFAEGRTRAC